jgi:hypothetical protein
LVRADGELIRHAVFSAGLGNLAGVSLNGMADVTSIDKLVRRYAWRLIASPPEDPVPRFHIAVELPDGRKFWRIWISNSKTPDQLIKSFLGWPDIWFRQFEESQLDGFVCWHQVP